MLSAKNPRRLIAGVLAVGVVGSSGGLGTGSAVADPVYAAEDPVYAAEDPTTAPAEVGGLVPAKVVYAIGGARPPGIPWERYTVESGGKYLPGVPRQIIDYPAGALFSWVPDMFRDPGTPKDAVSLGYAADVAEQNLDIAIRQGPVPSAAVALSGGNVGLDQEIARLAKDPSAPPPDALSFITIGDPTSTHAFGASLLSGLAAPGTYFPEFDFTVPERVDSQYNNVKIVAAYDGFADFPDRPENPFALVNAIVGASVVHTPAAFTSPDMVPAQNIRSITNSRGGTTTTFLVPSQHLPLTVPLREFGGDTAWLDQVDAALQPIIDAGYSRNDDPATRPLSLDPNGMDPLAVLDAPEQKLLQGAIDQIRGIIPGVG